MTIERALSHLQEMAGERHALGIDPRAQLLTTLVYVGVVLSVPILDPGRLVWLLCYPIVMAEVTGQGYGRVLWRSLCILPLVVLIAMFNPILDHAPLWKIGSLTVSAGWVSFISVIARGLLAMQALIVLVDSTGFLGMCQALQGLGCPAPLATQMFMLYRYIGVLLSEALTMQRARQARGYGRKNYPLRMWATFAGQLLLRSVERARRINRAMLARGFAGSMPRGPRPAASGAQSIAYFVVWLAVLLSLRLVDLSELLGKVL